MNHKFVVHWPNWHIGLYPVIQFCTWQMEQCIRDNKKGPQTFWPLDRFHLGPTTYTRGTQQGHWQAQTPGNDQLALPGPLSLCRNLSIAVSFKFYFNPVLHRLLCIYCYILLLISDCCFICPLQIVSIICGLCTFGVTPISVAVFVSL